mgnify:CR=1 FL=1
MHNQYILQKIELGNKCAVKERIKIAIANIKLDTKRCCLGLACGDDVEIDRLRLIDFMDRAYANGKSEKVDFLVFPEFYMPLQWISDVLAFVRKSGITVVSGLQYMNSGHQAYNNVAIFAPVNTGRYTSAVFFAREKNDYAPMERQILALALLKGWRKSDNKILKKIRENEAAKAQKEGASQKAEKQV